MVVNRGVYILCGGDSSRMGEDKSLLEIQGETLIALLARRCEHYFNNITVLRADKPEIAGFRHISDVVDDAGPLGGLLAALKDSPQEIIALLAVDLPNISDKSLQILTQPLPEKYDALLAKSEDRIQPLIGLYHRRIIPQLTDFLNIGERSVMAFTQRLSLGFFEVDNEELLNINSPEDFEQFLKVMERR